MLAVRFITSKLHLHPGGISISGVVLKPCEQIAVSLATFQPTVDEKIPQFCHRSFQKVAARPQRTVHLLELYGKGNRPLTMEQSLRRPLSLKDCECKTEALRPMSYVKIGDVDVGPTSSSLSRNNLRRLSRLDGDLPFRRSIRAVTTDSAASLSCLDIAHAATTRILVDPTADFSGVVQHYSLDQPQRYLEHEAGGFWAD
ncbi:hypothetical protein K438DRAFT_1935446 [Mycena galopus ATCC 62051]|nr:hypothetical protein K438DRAFT_1935446 [Mycena galopus ATCC 62051]